MLSGSIILKLPADFRRIRFKSVRYVGPHFSDLSLLSMQLTTMFGYGDPEVILIPIWLISILAFLQLEIGTFPVSRPPK